MVDAEVPGTPRRSKRIRVTKRLKFSDEESGAEDSDEKDNKSDVKVESDSEFEDDDKQEEDKVEELVQLQTPQKKRKTNLSKEHDFTSPLKKVIMENLQEYTNSKNVSDTLKLSRNFKPTQVPRPEDVEKLKANRALGTFSDTFEGFFDQRRPMRSGKLSTNSISAAPHVTREEFGTVSNLFHKNMHNNMRENLYELQRKLYPQYWFEITQGFSLLFYGIGSKRLFLENFIFEYLSPTLAISQQVDESDGEVFEGVPVVVVNGYNPTLNYRDIFKDILNILSPAELAQSESKFWGNHVILNIQKLIDYYKDKPHDVKLIVLIHNIDGPSIRRGDSPTIWSYLALIRQVAIVASADHIYAPFLWDNLRAQHYNFVFHDVTNYAPYEVESTFQDVMKIGKSENSTGAEGAKYVLQSLTKNSKKMYRLLIETQLVNMQKLASKSGRVAPSRRGTMNVGVEFKKLASLCAADFIASNEMALRSMLTEFIEHKMASVSKNNIGTEIVWVPYSFGETNKLLEILQDV
ncbi:Origin recognition complex subunit 2 [Nakaseomyces bracarensis]|uniref:Origin recognition complex subunit 2 n=1 Tax=Nakaseomyces bracarensis TaxID=273131 RepID=A0ABR4NMG9_9SACH